MQIFGGISILAEIIQDFIGISLIFTKGELLCCKEGADSKGKMFQGHFFLARLTWLI